MVECRTVSSNKTYSCVAGKNCVLRFGEFCGGTPYYLRTKGFDLLVKPKFRVTLSGVQPAPELEPDS